MPQPQVLCIDCGSPLKATNRGGVRCGECNAEFCARFGGRGPYLPTEEELEQVKAEIRAAGLARMGAIQDGRQWWE